MAIKRKATSPVRHQAKKRILEDGEERLEEKYGIVQREFYPPEMSNERAHAYANDEITRPIEELISALDDTFDARKEVKVKDAACRQGPSETLTASLKI